MERRKRIILCLLLISMFTLALCSRSGIAASGWSQTYGGSGDDEAYSLVQTSDGGYALAGFTDSYGAGDYDGSLVKTDSGGNSVMPQSASFSIPYSAMVIVAIIVVIVIAAVVIARRRRPRPGTPTVQQGPPSDSGMKPT